MRKIILAAVTVFLYGSAIAVAQIGTAAQSNTSPTTAASSADSGQDPQAAPSQPKPYIGVGIVIRPRYLRLDQAGEDLVKQQGMNITSDMALDAMAKAADPALPADATKEQKTQALDNYLKNAKTYSDEVAAECNTVVAGGPADKAGIKQFDVIVEVNGKSIIGLDAQGLVKALKDGPEGSTVSVTVLRPEHDGSKSRHTYDVVRGTVTPKN